MHDVDRASRTTDLPIHVVFRTQSPRSDLSRDLECSAGATGGPVRLAAELLARFAPPDTGARLVDEHGPDGSGHCRGCPHAVTSAPVFPCRLRLIGEAAVELDTRIGAVA